MSTGPLKPDRGPRLGALLRIAHNANLERLAAWLATSGYDDLQPAHAAVIQPLWDEPDGARITALARTARITKQSMSALVDHLEATGYVERVEDPDDARAVRVRLTTRGRAYARAARGFSHSLEAEWAVRIGAERVEVLRDALERLRRSLEADDTMASRDPDAARTARGTSRGGG
jgi:DNA-binding MarR family transcriptional regulator